MNDRTHKTAVATQDTKQPKQNIFTINSTPIKYTVKSKAMLVKVSTHFTTFWKVNFE